MNKQPNILILIILTFFMAINHQIFAQCDSTNNEITDKIHYLGGWDSNGRPDYLESEIDTVSQDILDFVDTVLPESVNITDSGYFDEDVQPNTELKDTAEVYVTFVHEGASWKNAFGFYTYDLNNPPDSYEDIDSLNIIFPNVDSVSALKAGDQVYLGKFMPNTGIGYFVIAQGWEEGGVCIGKHIVFTDKNLNTITTPGNRQHSILLNNEADKKLLLGIEDQLRPSGDKDFNDIVFHISVSPENAVDTTDIPKIPTAKISGDTTLCEPEDEATIKIELTGTSPWTLVYNNGSEDITVENIQDSIYTFQTAAKDTITLVSVQDVDGMGIVSGSAIVQLAGTDAYFESDEIALCKSATGTVTVKFNGQGPFDFKYTDGSDTTLLTGITEDHVEIDVEIGKTYTLIQISDEYCTKILEDSLEVEELSQPTAEVSGGGTVCEETDKLDAIINFDGTAPFTFVYEIEGEKDTVSTSDNPLNIQVGADSTLTPLAVSDANCEGEVSGNASVIVSSEISATLTGINTSFCSSDSASLKVNLDGNPPFNFEISNGEWSETYETSESEFIFYVKQSGTYKISSISDTNCQGEASGEIEVIEYQTPTATISGSTNICNGNSAEIKISFTGNAPWTAEIKNGDFSEEIVSNEEEYIYETDMLGTFELVSVSDAHCNGQVSGEATIGEFDKPTASLSQFGEICGDDEELSIELSFSGEAPFNYQYQLNGQTFDASSSNEMVEIVLGNNDNFKLLSFEDANCSGTINNESEYEVIYYQSPSASISGSSNVCNGETATITIEFTGNAPWTTEIKNGDFTEMIVSNEKEFTYETNMTGTFELISVSDAYCDGQVNGKATIGEFDKPSAELTGEASFCGNSTADLTVSLTGEAPFTFSISNGITTTEYTTSETEFIAEVNEGGNYFISHIEDANCIGNATGSVEVTKYEAPTASISGGGSICADEEVSIQIDLTGEAPITFEYTDGEEIFEVTTSESTYTFETSKAGTYTLESVSDINCDGEVSGEANVINVIDELDASIDSEDNYCEKDPIDLSVSIDGSFESLSWSSNGEGSFTNTNNLNTEYIPAKGESGAITIFVDITTECGSKQISKDIQIIPTPNALFNVQNEDLIVGDEIVFDPENDDYDTYNWEFGDGEEGSGNPGLHVFDESGIYTVSLTVEDQGCSNSAELAIELILNEHLYVPNVFNPSSDNSENRVVKVYGAKVSEENFNFKIVNRWGNTMYETNSFSEANTQGWDGHEMNNDEMQALTSFTYILKGKFESGIPFEKTGTITLLR